MLNLSRQNLHKLMSKYRHSFPVPVAQLTRQINLAGETQQAPPPADIVAMLTTEQNLRIPTDFT
ncbi:hypothetical protein KIV45_13995 [Janthinobacterium lividum]|nr:hypothetical protein KIV45_13995 [Janthinobacterium lividum]